MAQEIKTLNTTFLFQQHKQEFEKEMVEFINAGKVIDISSKEFEDIAYEVHKQQKLSSNLVEFLNFKGLKLVIGKKPMPRMMKVFMARDLKGDRNKYAIYIDVYGLIELDDNGKYVCHNISVLIANLIYAATIHAYHLDKITGTSTIEDAAHAFANLFTNIINYLFKINNINGLRNRCLFLSALYFLNTVYKKSRFSVNVNLAKKIANITEREKELLVAYLEVESFANIDYFMHTCNDILKLKELELQSFLATWIKLYTPGTMFALEYFPAFSAMLTDAYVGCFLNNQSTIEKVAGNAMVAYCNDILKKVI